MGTTRARGCAIGEMCARPRRFDHWLPGVTITTTNGRAAVAPGVPRRGEGRPTETQHIRYWLESCCVYSSGSALYALPCLEWHVLRGEGSVVACLHEGCLSRHLEPNQVSAEQVHRRTEKSHNNEADGRQLQLVQRPGLDICTRIEVNVLDSYDHEREPNGVPQRGGCSGDLMRFGLTPDRNVTLAPHDEDDL